MSWPFKIGDEVVCISRQNLFDCRTSTIHTLIEKGQVVKIDGMFRSESNLSLSFVELPGAFTFWSIYFRPTRKTDISVFQKLIAPSPTKAPQKVKV
jgi:hypothetical protein